MSRLMAVAVMVKGRIRVVRVGRYRRVVRRSFIMMGYWFGV